MEEKEDFERFRGYPKPVTDYILSLKVGDFVVVKHTWEDKEERGGRQELCQVIRTHPLQKEFRLIALVQAGNYHWSVNLNGTVDNGYKHLVVPGFGPYPINPKFAGVVKQPGPPLALTDSRLQNH